MWQGAVEGRCEKIPGPALIVSENQSPRASDPLQRIALHLPLAAPFRLSSGQRDEDLDVEKSHAVKALADFFQRRSFDEYFLVPSDRVVESPRKLRLRDAGVASGFVALGNALDLEVLS